MSAFQDPLASEGRHADEADETTAPVWSVFGDLMAGLVGAFVLVFIGVLLTQIDLVNSLQTEIERRQQEEARRMALEKALAVPLASGRVTLDNGRIGISGSVLFDLNSDQLRPEGEQLLQALVPPLRSTWASATTCSWSAASPTTAPSAPPTRSSGTTWTCRPSAR
jgi:hypothetical protein